MTVMRISGKQKSPGQLAGALACLLKEYTTLREGQAVFRLTKGVTPV